MCELTLLNNSMYQWRNYYGLGPGEHGGPQPQWAKWWPPGWGCTEKNIGQGLWYVKMSFSDHQNSVKSLQSPGNGISETLDSKILRVSIPWTLLKKLVYIRRSTRAFDTSTRGAFEHFEPGAPWYNVTPLVCTPVNLHASIPAVTICTLSGWRVDLNFLSQGIKVGNIFSITKGARCPTS